MLYTLPSIPLMLAFYNLAMQTIIPTLQKRKSKLTKVKSFVLNVKSCENGLSLPCFSSWWLWSAVAHEYQACERAEGDCDCFFLKIMC